MNGGKKIIKKDNDKDNKKKKLKEKNLERTSYYSSGLGYNPTTEFGITGAYESQGEKDSDNSYTE